MTRTTDIVMGIFAAALLLYMTHLIAWNLGRWEGQGRPLRDMSSAWNDPVTHDPDWVIIDAATAADRRDAR